MKTGVAAFAAADRAIKRGVRRNAQLRLERLRGRRVVSLFAMFAKHADETLREDGFERRRDEIRLDAHVHEAGDGAGRVVRVQRGENQVAGERRLHGDLRRFLVADFADENHVRVMTQNRTQPARKREAGLFVDLDLIDALELVFNRVFNRDDFADGIVDRVQRGVERGGFAAARRAGDEDDAVRQLENALETFQFAPVHVEFAHAAQRGILAKQTHHDRFAVQHRNDRNADVHFGVVETNLDAAILGQALFGDVQMAQNFDARNDRGLKALELRGNGNVLQHAVNPVADAEFVFEGFEVNVRRAQLDGIFQNLVDEADDGRFILGGLVQIGVLGIFINDLKTFFLVEYADGIGADAEAFFNFALDRFAGGQNRLQVQAGHGLQRFESLRGEEAAGGDFDGAGDSLARKGFLLQQNAGGKKREKLTIRVNVVQGRVSEAVFLRQPAKDVFLVLDRGFRANQRRRVSRRQLPGRDHAIQQLFQRDVLSGSFTHIVNTSFSFGFVTPPIRAKRPGLPV